MKKEIILAWTRDFTLAWAEWWTRDMSPRLEEVFGSGVPNQLSYFNGRLLETFRLADEAKGFIEAVVNADLKLLGTDKLRRYVSLIKQMRSLIHKTNKTKNFLDKRVFERMKQLAAEAYPWYTVSYLLPQDQWASQLKAKYPKQAPAILVRLIDARTQSEGAIEELVEYWKHVSRALLNLRRISSSYGSFVTLHEIEQMFKDPSYSPDRKQLAARSKSFIFLGDSVYTGVTKDVFFKKRGFSYTAPIDNIAAKEISGAVSSPGPSLIKGRVRIILRNDEIGNFKPGEVLVTVMTNPFFISVMKKAAVIITDEGGITCHAAIVSRELKIPCITGTKIATKFLKDGDLVEVDATNGIVRKLGK